MYQGLREILKKKTADRQTICPFSTKISQPTTGTRQRVRECMGARHLKLEPAFFPPAWHSLTYDPDLQESYIEEFVKVDHKSLGCIAFSVSNQGKGGEHMRRIPVVGGPKIVEKGQFVCLSTGFFINFHVAAGTFPTAMDRKHVCNFASL